MEMESVVGDFPSLVARALRGAILEHKTEKWVGRLLSHGVDHTGMHFVLVEALDGSGRNWSGCPASEWRFRPFQVVPLEGGVKLVVPDEEGVCPRFL